MTIRKMRDDDWDDMSRCYQDGIDGANATFTTTCPSFKDWDAGHLEKPRLVAEEEGKVIGFAVLSPTFHVPAYRGATEVSIYVRNGHQGKGVGKALLQAMLEEATAEGVWSIQALIFDTNTASRELFAKTGFRLVGHHERIAQDSKCRWHDTIIMEKRL